MTRGEAGRQQVEIHSQFCFFESSKQHHFIEFSHFLCPFVARRPICTSDACHAHSDRFSHPRSPIPPPPPPLSTLNPPPSHFHNSICLCLTAWTPTFRNHEHHLAAARRGRAPTSKARVRRKHSSHRERGDMEGTYSQPNKWLFHTHAAC